MAALPPQFAYPRIASLRGTRRSRGPMRGRVVASPTGLNVGLVSDSTSASDLKIQETDYDASISRLNAVSKGYLNDTFAEEFVLDPLPPRRLPLINRGTYMRTTAVDNLVEAFILSNNDNPCQIVSLGAGTDTRYWRLKEQNLHGEVLYHEIDFPAVSAAKLEAVRRSSVLSPVATSFNVLNHTPTVLEPEKLPWGFIRDPPDHSQGYLFHPLDLRSPFQMEFLQTDVPTLLLSECCLCYLEADAAERVIKYFTDRIAVIGIALYEPIKFDTPFGNVMANNLASRGLAMPTVHRYPTLESQITRLKDAGFITAQSGGDMLWLWENWVEDNEKERIAGLEMMDELEEWELLASHYAVVWGWREIPPADGSGFNDWLSYCQGLFDYPDELMIPADGYQGPELPLYERAWETNYLEALGIGKRVAAEPTEDGNEGEDAGSDADSDADEEVDAEI